MTKFDANSLLTILADLAHRAWTGWMDHLFTRGTMNDDGSFTICADSVKRWQRQMTTSYSALPKEERLSDIAEARGYLAAVIAYISAE